MHKHLFLLFSLTFSTFPDQQGSTLWRTHFLICFGVREQEAWVCFTGEAELWTKFTRVSFHHTGGSPREKQSKVAFVTLADCHKAETESVCYIQIGN